MYDGTRIQTYVDGILQDLEGYAGTMVIEDYRVYIGGSPEEPKKRWKDFIDDARTYSHALSPEEVKMLYEGKEPPK